MQLETAIVIGYRSRETSVVYAPHDAPRHKGAFVMALDERNIASGHDALTQGRRRDLRSTNKRSKQIDLSHSRQWHAMGSQVRILLAGARYAQHP